MDLNELATKHRQELRPVAGAVLEATAFTLDAPCALVVDGAVVSTTLNGLRNHLPCSVALASAPLERFLTLREEVGFDRAFELCSTDDDDDGEEFVNVWDEAQRNLDDGVLVTVNDLVAFAEQAKKGWSDTPRRVLVVAVEDGQVASGSVSTDWVFR
jgi:hypothetical protein